MNICLGGDDANISSPIHQTEGKFLAENQESSGKMVSNKRGLGRLADLAQNINQWEDDLTHVKKTCKSASPVKTVKKAKAPDPPRIISHSPKKEISTSDKVLWDKGVLDSLVNIFF